MQPNVYNWSTQTREHFEFAAQNYPTIAGLASDSDGYAAYALRVQALPPPVRRRYLEEWGDWYEEFGRAWERLGGMRERRLGQITSRYKVFVPRFPVRPLGAFGAATGTSQPSPPVGFRLCTAKPPGGWTQTGGPFDGPIPGWRYVTCMGVGQGAPDMAGVEFFQVWPADQAQSAAIYFLPSGVSCSGVLAAGASAKASKIKELQKALNQYGYGLSVDGVFGPNTCAAAYDYQQSFVGSGSSNLTGDTFVSLGLPSSYAAVIGGDCKSWYQATTPSSAPESMPVPAPMPAPAPMPEKAGMSPWLLVLLGGALIGGAVYAGRKLKKKKGK